MAVWQSATMARTATDHTLWGYEPYPDAGHPWWGYAPARPDSTPVPRRSKLSTASLVVGIIGTVLVALSALAPWLVVKVVALLPSVTLGTLAVVFAAIALNRARRASVTPASAKAGLTLGIVDLSLSAVVLIVILAALMVQIASQATGI
jgi:hypothetical protein